MSAFKPLLAEKCLDINQVMFPVYASPKLDGIRSVIYHRAALTRSLKPIPNNHIREILERYASAIDGLDGELIVGEANAPDVYTRSVKGIMSHDGQPDFTYVVFDYFPTRDKSYSIRMEEAKRRVKQAEEDGLPVRFIETLLIKSAEELAAYEVDCLNRGYEGVMIRDPHGFYKHGRSTLREGILLKLKVFEDMEAEIVGFEELMHNDNEAEINALGHTERSSKQENLTPGNTLGALVLKAAGYTMTFKVGTGFSAAQRKEIWDNKANLIGQLVKIKHQPHGAKDRPRCPVFLGFRHVTDLALA